MATKLLLEKKICKNSPVSFSFPRNVTGFKSTC